MPAALRFYMPIKKALLVSAFFIPKMTGVLAYATWNADVICLRLGMVMGWNRPEAVVDNTKKLSLNAEYERHAVD